VVRVRCSKYPKERDFSEERWTIHEPARFLQPHLQCDSCGNKKTYFRAVNPTFPTIKEASLYSIITGFREVGCELFDWRKIEYRS
jgi:hypothetical protein